MLLTIKQGVVLGWLFSAAWKEKSSRLLVTLLSSPLLAPTHWEENGKCRMTEGCVTPRSVSLLTPPGRPAHPCAPSIHAISPLAGPMKGWPLDPFTGLSTGESTPPVRPAAEGSLTHPSPTTSGEEVEVPAGVQSRSKASRPLLPLASPHPRASTPPLCPSAPVWQCLVLTS